MRPSSWVRTCWAVTGAGWPEMLALVAAMGAPRSASNTWARGWLGTRTATVSPPEVTVSEIWEPRARTKVSVWGEVEDDQGQKAVSRLYGPEAGVVWTGLAALAAVRKVLDNEFVPGFQTPSLAYGADFVLECEGVTREDVH